MTLRANSFRSILVDSGMFLLAMTLVAAVAVSANSQEVNDLRPDPRTTDDAIDSRQNTDDNLPDGNPTETFADKTQNQVLGMTLVEAADGRTMVADVAATSPAWDAGVRRGDQVLELHGLKTADFAKWSKDIRPLLRDAKDGDAVPLVVSRRGEPLSLRVKLPVSRAAEVRDARQEEQAIAKQARQQQRQQQGQAQGQGADRMAEYGADPGYGYPRGYGGGGGFGFIGDEGGASTLGDDGNHQRATNAVAELFGANQLGGQGGRVGMAVFQNNDDGGVRAHVEVHGLQQGNYRVGISDGGGMGGFNNPFASEAAADDMFFDNGSEVQDQTNSADDGTRRPSDRNDRNNLNRRGTNQVEPGQQFNEPQQQTPFGTPRVPNNNVPQNTTPGVQNNTPSAAPGTGTAPAPGVVPPPTGGGTAPAPGGGGGAGGGSSSLASPASAFLAQQAIPQTVPPPQDQLNAPGPSGPNRNRVARGETFPESGGSNRPRVDGRNVPPNGGFGGTGAMPNFLAEIGMLQVGANGVGQVQNQLQGMNVGSLAGLSVIVVPARSEANTGVGFSNPNANTNAGTAGTGTNSNLGGENAGSLNPALNGNQNRLRNNAVVDPNTGAPANLGSNSGIGPVAQGVIRLVEGSGLPPQQSTDPDDMRQQQSLRDADRIREDAQQRDLTTPPDRTFDPSQRPATR